MWNVKGEFVPFTGDTRFVGAVKDYPQWSEASEVAARLAHACETPWDAVRAYASFAEQFPEYPHGQVSQTLSHHVSTCDDHTHLWNDNVIYTGVRWVEARSRTLPDAVIPLVEHNVRRAWRSVQPDDPHEVLGDLHSAVDIDAAWEAGLDLFHLRRGKPPNGPWADDVAVHKAFVCATYPGFSDESYWTALQFWYWVMR